MCTYTNHLAPFSIWVMGGGALYAPPPGLYGLGNISVSEGLRKKRRLIIGHNSSENKRSKEGLVSQDRKNANIRNYHEQILDN